MLQLYYSRILPTTLFANTPTCILTLQSVLIWSHAFSTSFTHIWERPTFVRMLLGQSRHVYSMSIAAVREDRNCPALVREFGRVRVPAALFQCHNIFVPRHGHFWSTWITRVDRLNLSIADRDGPDLISVKSRNSIAAVRDVQSMVQIYGTLANLRTLSCPTIQRLSEFGFLDWDW